MARDQRWLTAAGGAWGLPARLPALLLAGLPLAGGALAHEGDADPAALKRLQSPTAATGKPYSAPVQKGYPLRPLFGDTHLHTAYSMDAGAFGARITPREAYRLAMGHEITSSTGQPLRLSRPLDFLVVADHSDGMGFFPLLHQGTPKVMANEQGRRWHEMIKGGKGGQAAVEIIQSYGRDALPRDILPTPGTPEYAGAWQEIVKAAEEANAPGRFTALIGYEWTSNTGGNNLHRNVIYRDGADKAGQLEPYTTLKPLGSDNPRDLWKWMGTYEARTGGKVLAIAHNGNLSNGRMFPVIESFTGKPLDREYAEQRARWEPLYEATQIKGDGETHPLLSPNDEFAAFERWDKGNLDLSELKKKEMLEFEYARSALKNGLALEKSLGTNPYRFGMIGSTDSHTGLATADADNFYGKVSILEPGPGRIAGMLGSNKQTGKAWFGWETVSSGYAAVWARDNTRESIFDAMLRRETYATTGPRMTVRFFGGWEFAAADARRSDLAGIGYAKGVPMGGQLPARAGKAAPSFLIAALKDPLGANLDRVQVVKGWLDGKDRLHEKVYNVSWSNAAKRQRSPKGELPPVGNTVDVANANWSNSIGDTELVTVWKDPDFQASEPAFYYLRVLEIPTPRWTAYDAKHYQLKNLPKEIPMVVQQRAYTSPIWYRP